MLSLPGGKTNCTLTSHYWKNKLLVVLESSSREAQSAEISSMTVADNKNLAHFGDGLITAWIAYDTAGYRPNATKIGFI